MSVVDETGKNHSLISLWERRKLVLVFTRHMGCRFCKEQVSELNKIQPMLLKEGITAGIITVGKYEDIPKFKKEHGFKGEVYVDSELFSPECYKRMKLGNGMEYLFAKDDSKDSAQNFRPETQEAAVRAVGKGFQDGGYGTPDSEYTGDTLQIGGAFVLGPGNSCDYSYRCAYVGDLVDLTRVVAAATGRDANGDEIFYSRTLDWNDKLNVVEAHPPGPVRRLVSELRRSSHLDRLLQCLGVGCSVFLVTSVVVLYWAQQAPGLDVESALVSLAVTIGALSVASFVWSATTASAPRPAATETPTASAKRRVSTSVTTPPPASSAAGALPTIGGCPLLRLSAIDKAVLTAPAGDLRCDCTFLEEVDMINMTDRYTLSAPTAVNAGLFDHLSAHHHSSAATTLDGKVRDAPHSSTSSSPRTHRHGQGSTAPSCPFGAEEGSATIVSDPVLTGEHLMAAQSTLCYVREFLAKPNPNLGRKGPTCPFVPKSLQLDSIYLGVLSAEETGSAEDLEALLLEAIAVFLALEPRSGPKASYKAIILVFPDMEPEDVSAMIDGTQKRLKPSFVQEGLMLGEFHLRNNATGLHNEYFYPLRTPYPCLAIRHMVPSDIVFLNPAEFAADVRASMIRTFLGKFGDKASNDQQTEVARALLKELENAPK